MNKNNLKIGVFDSGMGGLTVLKELKAELPNESFIYLGDMARVPYGTKSQSTVKAYASQMARILVDKNIKAMVIACNTATTAALHYLQEMMPDIPILGVIEPGAKEAICATETKRIAVFATQTTIGAKAYQQTIQNLAQNIQVTSHSCNLLVALAEEGMVDNQIAKSVVQHYLRLLSDEDVLVLGCTHFPIFKPLLETLLPSSVKVVDSAKATAKALKQQLIELKLLAPKKRAKSQFMVTDSIERFQKIAPLFLGQEIIVKDISLIDNNLLSNR